MDRSDTLCACFGADICEACRRRFAEHKRAKKAPPPPAEQASGDALECIAQAAAALDVLGRKPLAAWLMRTHTALSQRPVAESAFTLREIVQALTQHYKDATGDQRHVPATQMAFETSRAMIQIIYANRESAECQHEWAEGYGVPAYCKHCGMKQPTGEEG